MMVTAATYAPSELISNHTIVPLLGVVVDPNLDWESFATRRDVCMEKARVKMTKSRVNFHENLWRNHASGK
jgi:hypothetical protein